MKKVFLKTIVLCLSLLLIVSACGTDKSEGEKPSPTGSEATGEPGETSLQPVQLTWYLSGNPPADVGLVEEEANAYLQPRINASLKLQFIPSGNYPERMNTLLSSGEAFDLLWTANWSFLYDQNARRGAFTELNELLPAYAPNLLAKLPEVAWEDAKLQGKLYAVPNYQIAAKVYGFVIQKRFVDKYDLDTSTIKGFKDLEPFLELIKQNEPDMIPYATIENFRHQMHGFDGVNNVTFYRANDPSYQVVELAMQDEYLEFHKMLHEWFNKGYINRDIATANINEVISSGKVAVRFDQTLKPGGEIEEQAKNGGHEVVYIPLSEPEFTGVQASMTAISRTSKNPERAMLLLELVNTEPELFNLLVYGIEGKHYEKVGENAVRKIPDSGYSYANWRIGNTFIGYLTEGQPEDTWELTMKMNESAIVPEIFGFNFDITPVQAEAANIAATQEEYRKAIESGTVDPEQYVPRYRDALQKSGLDKLLEEHQRQLDQWLAEKGMK